MEAAGAQEHRTPLPAPRHGCVPAASTCLGKRRAGAKGAANTGQVPFGCLPHLHRLRGHLSPHEEGGEGGEVGKGGKAGGEKVKKKPMRLSSHPPLPQPQHAGAVQGLGWSGSEAAAPGGTRHTHTHARTRRDCGAGRGRRQESPVPRSSLWRFQNQLEMTQRALVGRSRAAPCSQFTLKSPGSPRAQ